MVRLADGRRPSLNIMGMLTGERTVQEGRIVVRRIVSVELKIIVQKVQLDGKCFRMNVSDYHIQGQLMYNIPKSKEQFPSPGNRHVDVASSSNLQIRTMRPFRFLPNNSMHFRTLEGKDIHSPLARKSSRHDQAKHSSPSVKAPHLASTSEWLKYPPKQTSQYHDQTAGLQKACSIFLVIAPYAS